MLESTLHILLAHFLYQDSLAAEARRAEHAGWFTFVMADAEGKLLNIEGSPKELEVEEHRTRLARVSFGSRKMTGTQGDKVKYHPRCQKMYDHLAAAEKKTSLADMQTWFADPAAGISVGKGTIDLMVFNTTRREALVSRGPSYGVQWQKMGYSPK